MHAVNFESSGKTAYAPTKMQIFGAIVGTAVLTYYLPVPLTAVL